MVPKGQSICRQTDTVLTCFSSNKTFRVSSIRFLLIYLMAARFPYRKKKRKVRSSPALVDWTDGFQLVVYARPCSIQFWCKSAGYPPSSSENHSWILSAEVLIQSDICDKHLERLLLCGVDCGGYQRHGDSAAGPPQDFVQVADLDIIPGNPP